MFCFMLWPAWFGNNATSQTVYTQNNCSTSVLLGNADTCNPAVQTYGDQLWFSFTASQNEAVITVTNSSGYGHIHSIAVYDSCSSPALDSTSLTSDTSTAPLIINAGSLTIGKTYYLLMAREKAGCIKCSGTGQFGYCIGYFNTAPSEAALEAMEPNWYQLSTEPGARYDSIV